MSNSSEMGSMGPKFGEKRGGEKVNERSEKKKKSKKVLGTVSTTNIQKQQQNNDK